jgi:hypothetical protein
MLLCMLPTEETFAWGRRGDRKPPEDIPDMFYDFCNERAEELRAQILSSEGAGEHLRRQPRRPVTHTGWGRAYWGRSAEAITCRKYARCSRP